MSLPFFSPAFSAYSAFQSRRSSAGNEWECTGIDDRLKTIRVHPRSFAANPCLDRLVPELATRLEEKGTVRTVRASAESVPTHSAFIGIDSPMFQLLKFVRLS
jgi:hypothetical protein